ncbi:MAG: family efflux transporter subunit [Gemmatimonadetes bacterium]|nr:family efflux transporter subunit [Gemmatimonadota bacterium]
MDIERDRPSQRKKYVSVGIGVAILLGATVALMRLKPAVTTMERAGLTFDTVSVGDMVRDVRGPGTLVAEHTRIIVASTGGRIEALPVRAGQAVTAGTTIVLLSNADVELQALQVQQQLTQAYASLAQIKSFQQQQRTTQQGTVAQLRTQHLEAQRAARVLDSLDKGRLATRNEVEAAHDRAQEVTMRYQLEQRRVEEMKSADAEQVRLAEQQIGGLKEILQAQHNRVSSMRVTAGESGQLQSLGSPQLEVGQWVNSGIELARVAQPGQLKAVLRIPETMAKDVAPGQRATIDTRDGIVMGRVTSIDPVSRGATVTIEVALEGPLPRGARADLTVDGAIEIERLHNVMYVSRPAYGAAESTIRLFKVTPNAKEAIRVSVTVGKASVNSIVVKHGLARGDSVIISDMSQMLTDARVRLR